MRSKNHCHYLVSELEVVDHPFLEVMEDLGARPARILPPPRPNPVEGALSRVCSFNISLMMFDYSSDLHDLDTMGDELVIEGTTTPKGSSHILKDGLSDSDLLILMDIAKRNEGKKHRYVSDIEMGRSPKASIGVESEIPSPSSFVDAMGGLCFKIREMNVIQLHIKTTGFRLINCLTLFFAAFRTDEIRRTPLTPQDEMRAGMSYFHEIIWKGVPKYLRHVDTALKNIGINECNPRFTHEVTRDVCLLARMMAANLYYSHIEDLMFELSMWRCSDELRVRAEGLHRSSKRDAKTT
ncbi:Phosphoenolpyruvate carboxylase 1 [Camellia lanceoleosa]|uniref:Phosphoenolpyruvate carboxylase 1 n=1 Tax=Camellia lanceoleosa TaxID=1840588 RepID=A0ACC0HWH3_9ERIC|nr:Phosphoenolpyruvate carboxylase 1 [Camellia lanceoleosa]